MKDILKVVGKYVLIVLKVGAGICVAAEGVKEYVDGNN